MMKSTRRKFLATALLTAGLLIAAPAAFAHAHPKVMFPTADSVGPSPAMVKITFSEALEPKFSSINVTDEAGKKCNTATSMPVEGDAMTLTLALPTLPAGGYVVHWVSVATDGHRLEGSYKFTVK
jgi:methionine-rich copper-binding protein CopC